MNQRHPSAALSIFQILVHPTYIKFFCRQPKPRLFHRIRIPEALVTQEGFDGGGKYTLYRITYKIYRPVSSLVMNSSSSNENNSNELSLDRSSPSSEILIQPVDCNKTVQSTDQNCELEEVKHQVGLLRKK